MNRREFIAGAVAAAVAPSVPTVERVYLPLVVPPYTPIARPSITGCYALRPFKAWKAPEDIHYDPASFGKALCPKGSGCEVCWPKVAA